MIQEEDRELEDYIEEWHAGDEPSHRFAQEIGAYLFRFMDHLQGLNLSQMTLRKHIDNCWCIGYLECCYGYSDEFDPEAVFYGPDAPRDLAFRRKFTDSDYAVKSYRSTWRKLYAYTKASKNTGGGKAGSSE